MGENLEIDTKKKVEKRCEEEEEFEPASPNSKYWLSEVAKLYILSIFELEIPINSSDVYAFFSGVFLDSHPRFSCIPIEDKKGKIWWKRVEVNVENHIKAPNFPEDLTPEIYTEHLDDYMSEIATSEFEIHKPLWEVHKFNYPTKNATSTLIVKFHHALGDGASLMAVVFSCFKRADDPTMPLTFPSTTTSTTTTTRKNFKTTLKKTFNIVPKYISSFFYLIYDFGQTLRMVLVEDDRTPIHSGNTNMALPCSARVCSVNLSLTEIKSIKSTLKVTVNDVIIGIIAFATRLYNQEIEQGRLKKKRITATIPINMRSTKKYASPEEMRKGNTWGNKISIIALPLPNLREDDLKNPIKFIMKAHKIMKRKRSNIASLYITALTLDVIRFFGGFEAAARSFERSWKHSSFTISNMIGPIESMSIGNHPIKGFFYLTTGMNMSLAVTVMSYMDKLRVGLVVENDFIDQRRLVTCVENAYHLIYQAAMTSTNSAVH